ncbi:MAG: uroporphyrinogen-III synthase [Nitrososphaerales archaeon]
MAKKLKSLGASVVEFASIKIGRPSSVKKLDSAISRTEEFDWIVFTSANGVKFFFERCAEKHKLKKQLHAKFACVGPSTRSALEELGFKSSFQPKGFLTARLGSELADHFNVAGARILLARAEKASSEITSILESAGAIVEEVPTYRTLPIRRSRLPDNVLATLTDITLTSPSTVESLAKIVDFKRVNSLSVSVHCIGPVTARKAKELGLKVTTMARTHTIDGLLKEIVGSA